MEKGCRRAATFVEIEAGGHRLDYLSHLWSAADQDRSLVVTTERAAGSDEFRERPALAGAHVHVIGDECTRRQILSFAIDRASASSTHLVVPDSDLYLTSMLAHLLRRPWTRLNATLLVMRPTVPFGGKAATRPLPAVAKIVVVQLLRLFPQVRIRFLTDALGVVRSRAAYPGVRPVPDPVAVPSTTASAPPWFPAADRSVTLVGVFGVIGARKNLGLLLRAVESVDGAVLVVGGRLEPSARAALDEPSAARLRSDGRLVVHDGMLTSAEFDAALTCVDVTAVLHDNDLPSGILAEGCARGVPCLVPVGGWLERVVTETGVGRAVDLTPDSVADGIRDIAGDRSGWRAAVRRQSGRIGVGAFVGGMLD